MPRINWIAPAVAIMVSGALLSPLAPASARPAPASQVNSAAAATPAALPPARKSTGRPQAPKRPLALPYTLTPGKRTTLVQRRVRTNAGQVAKVKVSATVRSGNKPRAAKASQFRVIRRANGKIVVWVAKGADLAVTVRISAPATKKYSAYRHVVSYPGGHGDPQFIASLFKYLFGKLVDTSVSTAAKSVVGWASSVMFGTTDPAQETLAKLDQLSAQVKQLSDSIAELKSRTEFGFCKGDSVITGMGLAKIDTANDRYQTLLRTRNTTRADWMRWVSDYVFGPDKVDGALREINRTLDVGVEGAGSIGSCAQAMLNDWTVPLAEAAYYERLYNYLNYFVQYQLLGLNLVVEAYHLRATEAAIAAGLPIPTAPEDLPKLCVPTKRAALATVDTECNGAVDEITTVRNNIATQAVAAGAGYAWNPHPDGVAMATQRNTNLVWVTNLTSYGAAGCQTPLSSRKGACGPTVGTTGPLADPARMGYTSWRPALAEEWRGLLAATPGRNVALSQVLESAGMAPGMNQGLIVYTGQVTSPNFPGLQWPGGWDLRSAQRLKENYSAMCFADTNLIYGPNENRIFCDGQLSYVPLADKRWAPGTGLYGFITSDLIRGSGTDQDFYEAALRGKRTSEDMGVWYDKMSVVHQPGWMATDSRGFTSQYRWPVFLAPSGTGLGSGCSTLHLSSAVGGREVPLTGRNNGGAVSMCGSDFAAWLETWLPAAPVG